MKTPDLWDGVVIDRLYTVDDKAIAWTQDGRPLNVCVCDLSTGEEFIYNEQDLELL